MKAVTETNHFAASIKQNPGNRERLLAMNPTEFIRQMAYWEAFFITSGDLPIAGCRLSDEEWASIQSAGEHNRRRRSDASDRSGAARGKLLPKAHYRTPIVTEAEWDANFSATIPYPTTSNFQGERIAPVWRDFIRQTEA